MRFLAPLERKVPRAARPDLGPDDSVQALKRTNVRAINPLPDPRSAFMDTDFAWAYRLEAHDTAPAERSKTPESAKS